MNKSISIVLAAIIFSFTAGSCTKCYVCTDKTSTTYQKTKYCDKDFDKGDIDAIIENLEDQGYQCHAASMAL